MPKESKRFINPLLRPTVEVEKKQEEVTVTQTEQPAAPVETHTSTDTYTAMPRETLAGAQTSALPSPISPTTEPHPTVKRREMHPSTDTSTFREEMKTPEVAPEREALHTERDGMAGGESMALYTSSVAPRYRNDQVAVPERRAPINYPMSTPIAPYPAAQATQSAASTEAWTPAPSPDTSSLPSTSTYTSAEQDPSSVYVQHDEVGERERYSAPLPSRRRRGAQSFEKTHERITLWIDKRLKQAFEELAYEQDISKTALLNEAVADLLNKYASR